jgi:hypothetical protein
MAFVFALILSISTLLLITNAFGFGSSKTFDIIAYSAWTILPPSWFMFEYTWLFPEEARFDSSQLADLKYKHELAGKNLGWVSCFDNSNLISKVWSKYILAVYRLDIDSDQNVYSCINSYGNILFHLLNEEYNLYFGF